MSATEVLDRPRGAPAPTGASGGEQRCAAPGRGDGGRPSPLSSDARRFGLWMFLATVTMLFVGFTSAYVVRRAAADWRALPVPAALWLSTTLLLSSSVAVEIARRRLRTWRGGARAWFLAGGVLGLLFVASQLAAWRELAAAGLYLASNPHSSFFFVLTGVHAAHLLGGLLWFGAVLGRLSKMRLTPGEDALGLFATYWHFLAALWVYLFLLLFVF